MSVILELRGRTSHVGIPLIHPTSESVVLANVFGTVKNLAFDAALNPWLAKITGNDNIAADNWQFSFWEKQPRPIGIQEGSTEVDLILTNSSPTLVFIEVKMDAPPSAGPSADPERNQLIRNLDIGNRRAEAQEEELAVIYITPDTEEPPIVGRIRNESHPFPTSTLFWSSWGMIGDILAQSLQSERLNPAEQMFTRDLLAYLAKKRLWKNTLQDDPIFYTDKLYRSLRTTDAPFIPYSERGIERDQTWRSVDWEETTLRKLLKALRWKDKFLLKLLADNGGAMRQGRIMQSVPFLQGKTSASLRALKSHINGACKSFGKAPILSEGSGNRDQRIHEINPRLGQLRQIVIEEAKAFVIPDGVLD